jgi:hypothetical protein
MEVISAIPGLQDMAPGAAYMPGPPDMRSQVTTPLLEGIFRPFLLCSHGVKPLGQGSRIRMDGYPHTDGGPVPAVFFILCVCWRASIFSRAFPLFWFPYSLAIYGGWNESVLLYPAGHERIKVSLGACCVSQDWGSLGCHPPPHGTAFKGP